MIVITDGLSPLSTELVFVWYLCLFANNDVSLAADIIRKSSFIFLP